MLDLFFWKEQANSAKLCGFLVVLASVASWMPFPLLMFLGTVTINLNVVNLQIISIFFLSKLFEVIVAEVTTSLCVLCVAQALTFFSSVSNSPNSMNVLSFLTRTNFTISARAMPAKYPSFLRRRLTKEAVAAATTYIILNLV